MSEMDLSVGAARRALDGLTRALPDDALVAAYARVGWSMLVEPGDLVAGALVGLLGPVRALELVRAARGGEREADAAQLAPGQLRDARERYRPRLADPARALEAARRAGAQLVTPEHPAWPGRLDDLGAGAPLTLWVRGDPALVAAMGPAVAIVGTRIATSYGELVAGDIAAESAVAGVTVVSGAAYGIDGAAHRGALTAGGATIAVLAGGVERPYPAGHRELIERIGREGAVISEMPCGAAPTKNRFLGRNRLIAALGDATIVVESGWRSGAHNTVHHAQEIGRPVGVVPGPVTSAASMGCHRLLRESDAVCVTGFADVGELLGLGAPVLFDAGPYTDDRTRILDALSSRSPRATDDVARRSGTGLAQAAALLGLLEIEGAAARRGDGWMLAGGMLKG